MVFLTEVLNFSIFTKFTYLQKKLENTIFILVMYQAKLFLSKERGGQFIEQKGIKCMGNNHQNP